MPNVMTVKEFKNFLITMINLHEALKSQEIFKTNIICSHRALCSRLLQVIFQFQPYRR